MRVKGCYQSGKRTEFDTGTFCSSEPFKGEGKNGNNITTEFSLRFDLLETEGLMLHIYWYNAIIDEQTAASTDASVSERPIPHAGREPGRFVRLVSKDELTDIAKIEVDGEMIVWRQGPDLINAIKFYNQELLCYSDAQTVSVNGRVMGIYSYLKNAHPLSTDEEISAMFGYPLSAFKRIQEQELAQAVTEDVEDEETSSNDVSNETSETDETEDMAGIGALNAFLSND